MELIKDYELSIEYHPGKANVVEDALSRKSAGSLACLLTQQEHLLEEMASFEIEVVQVDGKGGYLAVLNVYLMLLD